MEDRENEANDDNNDDDRKLPAKRTSVDSILDSTKRKSFKVPTSGIIRNPYANKGRFYPARIAQANNRGIARKPAPTGPPEEDPIELSTAWTTQEPAISNSLEPKSNEQLSTVSARMMPKVQNGELAFWERLPTQTTSLKPAEVMTVNECLEESISRIFFEADQPVRITGIVESRPFVDAEDSKDTIVELRLRDPLDKPLARKETKSIRTTGISVTTSLQKPAGHSIEFRKSLTSSTSKIMSNTKKVRRKRPWFVSSTKTGISNHQSQLDNKRAAVRTRTLSVLVDPLLVSNLHSAAVGSFVTVIGQFIALPILQESTVTKMDDPSSHQERMVQYKLEARTLYVASSNAITDMSLYERALKARRKTFLQRYHRKGQISDRTIVSSVDLLQGCGPPPYDVFGSGNQRCTGSK